MNRYLGLILLFNVACSNDGPMIETSAVRASLDDGQILHGYVSTTMVQLRTNMGTLAVPIGDVGEIEPIEGQHLSDSHNHIKIWLRNGSELVGEWANPELQFNIDVGNTLVAVDLPMDEMERFQLEDGDKWPAQNSFMVKTVFGDDIIIDSALTTFTLKNHLGTFTPTLAECKSLRPIGDHTGDWQVELHNGTVLIGPLSETSIEFALPLGPESITVSLEHITELERQRWGDEDYYQYQQKPSKDGWFDKGRYRSLKVEPSASES